MNYSQCKTVEEFRQWALVEHPAIRSLPEGEANILTSPLGFLWFGPDDGLVRWCEDIFLDWVLGPTASPEGGPFARVPMMWPETFEFNGWFFRRVEGAGQSGTYRRDLEAEVKAK